MSKAQDLLGEVKIVELTDDQIKDLIGYSFEALKRIEKSQKDDTTILDLKEKLKEYVQVTYLDDNNKFKSQLKAACNQARIRNIKYELPGALK